MSEDYAFGENWLNWIGIGLLLLGVVFLFRYSIDQGWLTPPVRSICGLGIGIVLLATGFRIEGDKQTLKQILLGGGVAAFYITGFATFQLYNFLGDPVIWGFMVVVTLLSLSLAMQQDEPILSVLGTMGGLGTPFMLYTGGGSLAALMFYTCLILSGAGAIYFFKGWKPLLWTMVTGGWLVMLVGMFTGIYDVQVIAPADQWTLQAGVLFFVGISWLMPVAREVLKSRDPEKWPEPSKKASPGVAHPQVQALSVITPLAAFFYSVGLWSISEQFWGAIALIIALLVGYSYLPLRNAGMNKLSLVHGLTALILLTVSLVLLLDGEILLIALTMEGLVLRIIAGKTSDKKISLASHILFGIIAFWMVNRFLYHPVSEVALLNLDAITELFIIGVAGLVVPGYTENDNKKKIYHLGAHVALLGWFMKELAVLEDGQAYVTIAWGIYALVLLFSGFSRKAPALRYLGMATIFLVTGKLFMVDLSQIQTVVRILLFLGFGTLFLAVGFYLQNRWGDLMETNGPGSNDQQQDDHPL